MSRRALKWTVVAVIVMFAALRWGPALDGRVRAWQDRTACRAVQSIKAELGQQSSAPCR